MCPKLPTTADNTHTSNGIGVGNFHAICPLVMTLGEDIHLFVKKNCKYSYLSKEWKKSPRPQISTATG